MKLEASDIFLVNNRFDLQPGKFKQQKEIQTLCKTKNVLPSLICMATYTRRRKAGIGIAAAFTESRIRFAGTDGMRGRVSKGAVRGCLGRYLVKYQHEQVLTPGLVYLAARAFIAQVTQYGQGAVQSGTVVCEDGRDWYQQQSLYPPLLNGLADGGSAVLSLGIAPTPAIAAAMQYYNAESAMVLTASHNPSNQNGVKFFFKGRKVMPEGAMGDYVLSALMYKLGSQAASSLRLSAAERTVYDCEKKFRAVFTDFIIKSLPVPITVPLMIDCANGAFSHIAEKVASAVTASGQFRVINASPRGSNINAHCGVASVEGEGDFDGKVPAAVLRTYPATVKKLFREGRRRRTSMLGITLDGDGDRGFLMVYKHKQNRVSLIDGDRCGYALAAYGKKQYPQRTVFAGTVESDIRLFQEVSSRLGLTIDINAVGDKWLLAGDRINTVLVGAEISGHILYPAEITDINGEKQTVNCGNGLFAMLLLAGKYGLKVPGYKEGFTRTLYTYNIDKNLFIRDNDAWKKDLRLMRSGFTRARKEGLFPKSAVYRTVKYKDEPDLLYAGMFDPRGVPIAVLFVRKSGTESKMGTYMRGQKPYAEFLLQLGTQVNRQHQSVKDTASPLYKAEQIIAALHADGEKPDTDAVCKACAISPVDIAAVIHGMHREGLLHD